MRTTLPRSERARALPNVGTMIGTPTVPPARQCAFVSAFRAAAGARPRSLGTRHTTVGFTTGFV